MALQRGQSTPGMRVVKKNPALQADFQAPPNQDQPAPAMTHAGVTTRTRSSWTRRGHPRGMGHGRTAGGYRNKDDTGPALLRGGGRSAPRSSDRRGWQEGQGHGMIGDETIKVILRVAEPVAAGSTGEPSGAGEIPFAGARCEASRKMSKIEAKTGCSGARRRCCGATAQHSGTGRPGPPTCGQVTFPQPSPAGDRAARFVDTAW